MKTAKSDIDVLNRYGIADAARTRITAQIFRNVIKPGQRQSERTAIAKESKAPKQR